MASYVLVASTENDDPVELPTESDDVLLLSTLCAQFSGACGLRYKNPANGAMRGLRYCNVDDGKIYPPTDGWGEHLYMVVFPKAATDKQESNTKRKISDRLDSSDDSIGAASKQKRVDMRKKCSDLIVLGLPFKTTEDEMREYFEQFGDVLVAQVKSDSKSGKSKGFGFVRFANYDSQLRVLSQRHQIQGRYCDVKIPNSKVDIVNPAHHKVFVGRVPENLTGEDISQYFSQFGEIVDVFMPRPYRAFAFVTFLEAEVAQALCGEDHVICGSSVHVSSAVPKEDRHNNSGGHHGGSPNLVGYGGANGEQLSPTGSITQPPASKKRQQNAAAGNWNYTRQSVSPAPPTAWTPANQAAPYAAAVRSTTAMGPPANPALAAGTNQATLGMGALNLGNLGAPPIAQSWDPSLLAATVQGALLHAFTAYQNMATPQAADMNAILAGMQTTQGGAVVTAGYGAAPPPPPGAPQAYWTGQTQAPPGGQAKQKDAAW